MDDAGRSRTGRSWRRSRSSSPARGRTSSGCSVTPSTPRRARSTPWARRTGCAPSCSRRTDAVTAAAAEAAALREQIDAATQRAQTAAERYRDLVVRTEPALPADLISGGDVDAIDASVTAAREIVGRVRTHIETQAQAGRVPAGAPPRSAPDLSALTPEQKIRHGLAARG